MKGEGVVLILKWGRNSTAVTWKEKGRGKQLMRRTIYRFVLAKGGKGGKCEKRLMIRDTTREKR